MNVIADDMEEFQFTKTLLYLWQKEKKEDQQAIKNSSSYVCMYNNAAIHTIIYGNLEVLAGAEIMVLCGPTYMIGIWGDSRSVFYDR